VNIIQAVKDPNLFQPFLGELSSWQRWLTALRCLYGLPIRTQAERELIRSCTGRTHVASGFDVALFLTGRRSGKSRTAAVIGAYEACLAGRESRLAKGERGIVLISSPTKAQSRIVKDYIRSIFEAPLLAAEIARETAEGFELKNGTRVEIQQADWRVVRGYSLLAAVVDEGAFLGYDSDSKVKSDTELIRAIQPSLATTGGKLVVISSPYAMKGWCYAQWRRHFGRDSTGSTLVWNCPSRTMNPTLPQSVVDEAMADDSASARAEYLGEFRDDVATFLPRDVIENLVVKGRKELPPVPGTHYVAFVDISGGRVDDAALGIGHLKEHRVILDFVRRWRPPFSPDRVIGEMTEDVQRYGVDRVVGDNYSAEFVKSAFESRGLRYARCTTNPWSKNPTAKLAKPKSQLYLELLPRLCSGEVELLDNELLVNQLAGLERRTRVGGRDLIDHGPLQHDDIANVVAGVADAASQKQVTAGVLGSGSSQPGRDPWARVAAHLEYENERLQARHALANEEDSGPPGWRDAMVWAGRL
jgi:hypothetical protein